MIDQTPRTDNTNAQRQARDRWRKNVCYNAVKDALAKDAITITPYVLDGSSDFDAVLTAMETGHITIKITN